MTKASAQITLFNINEIITSSSEPNSPANKQLWIDTSNNGSVIKQWLNSKWNVVYDWKPSIDILNGKIETTHTATSKITSELSNIDNKYTLKINQINKDYSSLNATIVGHNTSIESMKKSIQVNETNFVNVSASIKELKASIGSSKETMTTMENKITTLDTNTYKKSEVFTKEEVSSTIAATKKEINLSVDGKYQTKENTLTQIDNVIKNNKSYVDQKISTYTTTLSDTITKTKSSIDIELNKISEKVSSNTESNKSIQTTISSIHGTLATINENIKSQSSKIAGTETSINGVITRVASTEKTSKTLTESYSSLNGKVSGIDGTVSNLKGTVNGISSNLGSLTNNFNDLNKNVYRKTETLTAKEVESKIATATESINLSVSSKYATTTTVTTTVSESLNSAKSYADTKKNEAISSAINTSKSYSDQKKQEAISSSNSYADLKKQEAISSSNSYANSKKDEAVKDSKGYVDSQIAEVNKTITSNQAAINIFKDSISSKVSKQEETISSINGTITNHSNRLDSAEQKITSNAIINSISESLNNGKTITTTMTVTDKNGFTVKHNDGDYTTLSGKGLLRYRSSGSLKGEYHYLFHKGSVSNVNSKSTVRIQLPDDFKGLDYGISWWAGNIFPEKNGDLVFSANAEFVRENKKEGWFEIKASLMVRNPGSESSPNWRGKMNIMYMAIA